jgi:hypothetical protein
MAVGAVGAAVVGSSAAKGAANTAADAATGAANTNATLARENRDVLRSYVDPLTPYAYSGASALARRAGLSTGPMAAGPGAPAAAPANQNIFAAPTPAPAGSRGPGPAVNYGTPEGGGVPNGAAPGAAGPASSGPGGGADWNAYLSGNPDVAAQYQKELSTPEGQASLAQKGITSPAQYAQFHYQTYGQGEGRQLPTAAPSGSTPAPPGNDYALPDGANTSFPTAPTPGDRVSAARPAQPSWQDPGAAPDQANFFQNFEASPDYAFRKKEALDAANGGYAARGLLKSGAAVKAVEQRASNLAGAEYGDWWNRQKLLYDSSRDQFNTDRTVNYNIFSDTRDNGNKLFDIDTTRADSRYDTDRTYGRSVFNDDRNYQTNRYDTATNNLFNLTGIGTGAINSLAGVNTNYTNAAMGANTAAADATGNAALAGANSTNNLFGNALQGLGYAYGARSNPFGGSTTSTASSSIPGYTGVGAVNLGNPTYRNIFKAF